ncbi:MAG: C40 family peptidase [Parachlamydiaceae bacterium]|nr:C40 family peptidase [Parachlamydiaceae bacterium]
MHSAEHFYYINSPVVDMRLCPDRAAEVVSQAIFSEQVHFFEKVGEWVKIETVADQYTGWIKNDELHSRANNFLENPDGLFAQVDRNAAHLYHVPDVIYGPILTLPFESRLRLVEPLSISQSRWLKVAMHNDMEAYIQRGDVTLLPSKILNFDEICAFIKKFLGLPYTWGGRSSFGYDCSGFVQMLYRQMGILLPRDSKDQCQWKGFREVYISDLQAGDLLFFGLDIDHIKHVGMYVGDQSFINATVLENMPYVHISSMNGLEWQGNGTGKYPFRTVRRVIS